MNAGRYILSQILYLVHWQTLTRLAAKYEPDSRHRHFGFRQQFTCMVFAQMTSRDVLASKSIAAQACEKGVRGKPLTRARKRSNRRKSKRRSRMEHIFGFMTVSMKAMCRRCVGALRNRASIILCNLAYDMARTEQIIRLKILGRMTPQRI